MASPYDIAIHISMANAVSPVLAQIAKDMLGLQTSVGKLEQGLNKLGIGFKSLIGAGLAAGGAYLLVKGLDDVAKKGDAMLHQQALMTEQGWKAADAQKALNAAWKIAADIKVSSPSENVGHLRDLAYVTGDMQSAINILPGVLKANAVLNSMKGGGRDEVYNLVKALEQKGLATPEERAHFDSYVNTMTKAVQASGGRVTPQSFQSAFIYGRSAMFGWNEEFITQYLPRMIQEYAGGGGAGGVRGPGNMIMSAWTKVVQGILSKKSKEGFTQLGLYDGKEVTGADLFSENPYKWAQTVEAPALEAHGIDIHDAVEVAKAVTKQFGTRTAADPVIQWVLQGSYALGANSPFEKDARLDRQAMGENAYEVITKNDPGIVMETLASRFQMLDDAMAPLAQLRLDLIAGYISPFVETMAQLAHAHPERLKALAEGIAIMGAALAGAGIVGLVAFMSTLGAGAGGIVLAVGALTALVVALSHYKPATDFFNGLQQGLEKFRFAFNHLLNNIFEALHQGRPLQEKPDWKPGNVGKDGVRTVTVDTQGNILGYGTTGPYADHGFHGGALPPNRYEDMPSPISVVADAATRGMARLAAAAATDDFITRHLYGRKADGPPPLITPRKDDKPFDWSTLPGWPKVSIGVPQPILNSDAQGPSLGRISWPSIGSAAVPVKIVDGEHPAAKTVQDILDAMPRRPQMPGAPLQLPGATPPSPVGAKLSMPLPSIPGGYSPISSLTPAINVAAPNVNVSVAPAQISMSPTVTVTASLDGIVAALAAKITSVILGEVRTVSGAISTDGQVYARHPDMGGPR